MINIGGFGHSGNTALVDFFADSPEICPVGYDFTETAILRSKWGFRAIFSNFKNETPFIDWCLIQDCLLGVTRLSHHNLSPPVSHDFARNARVRGYLGAEYEVITIDFIEKLAKVYSKKCTDTTAALDLSKSFLDSISDLATKKSGRQSAIPMMRNDPAAANIDLLGFSNFKAHFTIVRDPGDMMYDWITYYKHGNDLLGAELFSKQFVKKINSFIEMYEILPYSVKSVIKILKFEDLVRSQHVQVKLCDIVNIKRSSTSLRFQPKVSEKNIGISQYLSNDGKAEVEQKCVPAFMKLLDYLPSNCIIE